MKNLKFLYILPIVLFLAACHCDCGGDITAAISNPARSDKDRERDATSKPAEILQLLNLRKGDHVADLFAGGGYSSELLGHVVGEKGEVIAHTVKTYHRFLGNAMEERFANNRMPQVRIYPVEPNDIELGTASLDAVLIVMSYHDLYFVNPEIDWQAVNGAVFLDKVYSALKPGGKLLIEDHVANTGTGSTDAQTLHRIEESFARSDIESHGFKLVQTSDVLRNPEDDHTKSVFDDSIRYKTDRFVLLFEKPSK